MSSSHKRAPIGAYVPPAKRVKQEKFDPGSEEDQRLKWDDNKKKITGLINRANTSNVTTIVTELFQCNLIRYKGLFAMAILKAQETSPVFTEVYAAILSVINSRLPNVGRLTTNRLVLQFKSSYSHDNKQKCLNSLRFLAHLINHKVICDEIAFELINYLTRKPDPFSIEAVVVFIKDCGAKLNQLDPNTLFKALEVLRDWSLEYDFDTRTHEMIDSIHNMRKEKFCDLPPIKPALDLIGEDDRITHDVKLSESKRDDYHMEFNYFKLDPKWAENEAKYDDFKASLEEQSGDEDDDSEKDGDDESSSESDSTASTRASLAEVKVEKEDNQEVKDEKKVDLTKLKQEQEQSAESKQSVLDATGADLIAFRRTVYLTFRSSVRQDEVVHKLLKSKIPPELYDELCQMILDCCGQERTYEKIFGHVASKLCLIKPRDFSPKFENLFELFYETVHRFETPKIRNIAKFYAHLMATESIDWTCMRCLKLRENATTSAGRCFIMFLFQELVALLSVDTLNEYIKEPDKQGAFVDLFPKDEEQDIRFAINFFTACNLGKLTEDLRQELASRQ